jgi:hypothetical protein
MRKFALALLLFCASTAALYAQSFDLDHDRQPIVSLDGLWRFHPGDNPAWSSPGLDDSTWPLLRADRSWSTQGYPGMSGYAWYRFTLRIPAGTPPVSLLLPGVVTGYTAYVDGRRVGAYGPLRAGQGILYPVPRIFPLTDATATAPTTLHIGLRVWHSPLWAGYIGGGPRSGVVAGDAGLVAARFHALMQDRTAGSADLYFDACLRGLMGLLILGLFLLRLREREYLWFAAVQLFGGADDVLNFFHFAYGRIPIQLFDLFDSMLAAGFWIAGLFFFATVLNQLRGRWFRAPLAVALLSPWPTILYWYGWVPVPVSAAIESLLVVPVLVWVLTLLIVRSVRRDPDARLLLLPVLLVYGDYLAFNLATDLQQLGIWPNAPDLLNYRFHLVPFNLGLYTHLQRRISYGDARLPYPPLCAGAQP